MHTISALNIDIGRGKLPFRKINASESILSVARGMQYDGAYLFSTQNAQDSPVKGTISTTYFDKHGVDYLYFYLIQGTSIYYANANSGTLSLEWKKML